MSERVKIDRGKVGMDLLDYEKMVKETKIVPFNENGSYDLYFDIYPPMSTS